MTPNTTGKPLGYALRRRLGRNRARAQAIWRRHHPARSGHALHQRIRAHRRRIRAAVKPKRRRPICRSRTSPKSMRRGTARSARSTSIGRRSSAVNFCRCLDRAAAARARCLMIAAGLVPPSSGAVRVEGRTVDGPRTDIGIVFQSPVLLEWRTALGNIMLQAEARRWTARTPPRARPRSPRLGRARRLRGQISA